MPVVLKSPLGPILQAIEDRLVAKHVVADATLVKWWVPGMQKSPPKFDANADVVLKVGGFTAQPVPSWQTGAGRQATLIDRRLDVIPRTRLLLDEPDRVKAWLLGSAPDVGYLPSEEAVIDALYLWTPLDSNSNHLTACDLHLLLGDNPAKEAAGWGSGGVAFQLKYLFPATPGFGQ